jgi:DNA-binding NarL/FixJ family response regulator
LSARVFIVDDRAFFRAGLRRVLVEHDFDVVGEAESGEAALPLIERRDPEVVVMDLSMDGMSGVEATRMLCRRHPGMAILVVTVSLTETDVLDALEAGASGYLLKDSSPKEIVAALTAALAGDMPLSPRVASLVVQRARRLEGADSFAGTVENLGDRELEILRLVAQGLNNGAIARELFLSETTVKRQLSTLFDKLEVGNRVQAAIWAARAGVV